MTWAFAKAESSHAGIFGKVADHIIALSDLKDFDEQHISNMVWAFAKADSLHP
eukprot:CAMPEP_0172299116 /NCGR_PEP_ID=MMETSP1058-20130122/1497_1 /TAXON_ID=83371 /ORGANISM="Detonula confervacea, Strain CCMP 353" /LENGTH=52 /DNA_ID=CAMNT_0013008447 /DNA_START=8 /DNA_END=162 /DNA_ORIENTATION=+